MKNSDHPTCPKCGSTIPAEAPGGICPKCALEGAATVASATTRGARLSPPEVGELAPHFSEIEILELLGTGGMGAVYKARQPQLDRFVALKILSHDLASDPAFVERFNREARVLARLNHPNIVGIFDYGTAGPYCYLLMEYVEGVNLRQAMQAGRFTPDESLAMVQHICAALKFAHEEGILHRDIKPENVLIDSKGRVKIADFGIAKLMGEDQQPDVTLTMQGSVLGSPHYMAPEQIETPGDVDQRADIYSLGVVLYELLTGELPIGRFALPSEKAAMDARIDQIVLRSLEKERQARFQTAEEVSTQVDSLTRNPSPASSQGSPAKVNETGMARCSLTSAILTGSSLILAALFLWLWVTTLTGSLDAEEIAEAEKMAEKISAGLGLAILSAVSAGATGLLGLILGSVALGRIRKSGGALDGFGLAAFGTVTWPLLLVSSLSAAYFNFTTAQSPGTSMDTGLYVLVSVVAFVLSAIFLVRGLGRWAKGVHTAEGGKRHPGFGLSASLAAAIMVFGSFLAPRLALGLFAGSDDPDPFDVVLKQEAGVPMTADLSSKEVRWHLREPEIILPLEIHSAFRAEFRLAQYDADGVPRHFAKIGAWEPDGKPGAPATCLVNIGTTGTPDDGADGRRGVTAQLGADGSIGTLQSPTDFADWRFELQGGRLYPLATAQGYTYTIARHEEMVEGRKKTTGVLKLEVQLIQR